MAQHMRLILQVDTDLDDIEAHVYDILGASEVVSDPRVTLEVIVDVLTV